MRNLYSTVGRAACPRRLIKLKVVNEKLKIFDVFLRAGTETRPYEFTLIFRVISTGR